MTEELGLTQPSYDAAGRLLTDSSPVHDEQGRPMTRNDSRDEHDSTYFTSCGDGTDTVVAQDLLDDAGDVAVGDGVETVFYMDKLHAEHSAVTIKEDAVAQAGVTLDATIYADPAVKNEITHFGDGKVTFDTAPAVDVVLTYDCTYRSIGKGTDAGCMVFDFVANPTPNPETIELTFCDVIHIKDGFVDVKGGAIDAKVNVYVKLPQGAPFYDTNKVLRFAGVGGQRIHHYVIDQYLLSDGGYPVRYEVESRSLAMPPGLIVEIVVDKGSSTTLQVAVQLEINRQRTLIY